MALIKSIPKPVTGTPLSYWRPCFWTRYGNRIELVVDGFFSPETRATGLPPDVQIRAFVPVVSDWIPPVSSLSELDYFLLRNAHIGNLSGPQVWIDAEDYSADPWRTEDETTNESQ